MRRKNTKTLIRALTAASMLAAAAGAAGPARGADAGPPGEVRDVLLLLPSGPRHVRIRIALGGRPLADVQNEYIDRLMHSLDTDGDGRLTRAEAARSPLRAVPKKHRENPFLASLEGDRPVTRRDIALDVARIASDTVLYRQDESAADNDDQVFQVLDADGSGSVDREEMRTAFLRILDHDTDRDQCVTFDEFPVPAVETTTLVAIEGGQPIDLPRPAISDMLRDVRQPTLPLRLVRSYDRNRDGRLSAKELGWDAARVAILDRNADRRLGREELTDLARLPVDLELAVELSETVEGLRLRVVSAASETEQAAPRPDLVRIALGEANLTFSFRQLDPVAQAVATAMQQFNDLDADANGYLERTEVSVRFRFERGLFDDIDRDGDDKLFGEEMRLYVAARAEPAAATCQINVYHTGHGFFQMLDTNGDGRISIRELRLAEQSLWLAAAGRGGALARSGTTPHFHIEFVRASYQLFGPSDGMVAQRPEFVQRPLAGPAWFRAMDRNGDGDLTWQEFLGPRAKFDELDADRDGLIDPREADAAGDPGAPASPRAPSAAEPAAGGDEATAS